MKDIKVIFIATHGEKEEKKPNPGLTEKGFAEITALKSLLPSSNNIICGTGKRHFDTAKALWLKPNRVTSAAGDADSMDFINGVRVVILADGTFVQYDAYTSLKDNEDSARSMIVSLPDNSIVCAGRPLLIMLGDPNGKSAAVYRVTIEMGEIISIEEIISLGTTDPTLQK